MHGCNGTCKRSTLETLILAGKVLKSTYTVTRTAIAPKLASWKQAVEEFVSWNYGWRNSITRIQGKNQTVKSSSSVNSLKSALGKMFRVTFMEKKHFYMEIRLDQVIYSQLQ